MYKEVDEISKRLLQTLRDKGHNINNDNGASNTIILAIAEAYGEGLEKGEKSGWIKAFDKVEESVKNMRMEKMFFVSE
jgi:hypothetical protein